MHETNIKQGKDLEVIQEIMSSESEKLTESIKKMELLEDDVNGNAELAIRQYRALSERLKSLEKSGQ